MSYTTSRNKENQWEVRYAGRLVMVAELEEIADDIAIALAAARFERLKREKALH